jgi:hypothetical protein
MSSYAKGQEMKRDPRITPVPGDVLIVPKFGNGTVVKVKRCGETKKGVTVGVHLYALDLHAFRNPGRAWALAYWPDLMKDARVVRCAEEQP